MAINSYKEGPNSTNPDDSLSMANSEDKVE